ncbi:10999_t:CDS:10, partial [Funneliformis caledonium]
GDDRKIAKDWDKERKSGKANVSPISINNSTISGSGIGTIERGTFTSVLQKERDQKETNPRKRANNTTAQRIKKIKTVKGLSASDSSTNESQKLDEHDAEEEIRSHTELNLANVDTPDYETTTRECSSDEMGESSENNIPNDSDSNETIEIKHDDLEELEQQITFSSLNEWEVGTVNVSRKFKEYQRQIIASIRQKKTKLTWNNTFELLALSSIIVMSWPCPYSTFTSSEWRQVLNSNPYKVTRPILTDSLLTTFYKATNDFSLGLNYSFTLNDDGELGEKARRIFNYIRASTIIKTKETETKHSVYNLDPFIKIIFGGEYTPYTLELNKSVNGKQRPDFSCVIDDIAILNSEIKPVGYTQYRKNQDFIKVHLKGKKSINRLLEKGGPNKSMAFLNMGDTIESFVIDLAYDGVYRSWPVIKNKLTTDKGSFPLIVLTFSHFVMIEQRVSEIINDYENRPPPGSYTPPEQIEKTKFIRKMPTTPQLNLLLKQ